MAKKSDERSQNAAGRLRSAVDSAVVTPRLEISIPVAVNPDVELWQIIVIGAIDPRQHQPGWYRLIGCIGEEEMKTGLRTQVVSGVFKPDGLISSDSNFQFDVGPFAVICQPDKWHIQTVSKDHSGRLVDVAETVFDKLNEISVLAYGVNRISTINLGDFSAKQFLSEQIAKTDLLLQNGPRSECQITCIDRSEEVDTVVQVSPSTLDRSRIQIVHNRHHRLPKSGGYFDVGDAIRGNAKSDWEKAVEYREEFTKVAAKRLRENHGK